MDIHGTQAPGPRKEIRCTDCGHTYLVSGDPTSSRCSRCGNIAYHEAAGVAALSREILHKNVLPLLAPHKELPPEEKLSFLEQFRTTQDGKLVQEILMKYQVEWQLWAMVVKHFADPAYHAAYLSQVISLREFDRASERYREHRSVMLLARDSHWQAEVADLMLERLQNLSLMRMQMEGNSGFRLPAWLLLLPLESRIFRLGWFLLGMLAIGRLFQLV